MLIINEIHSYQVPLVLGFVSLHLMHVELWKAKYCFVFPRKNNKITYNCCQKSRNKVHYYNAKLLLNYCSLCLKITQGTFCCFVILLQGKETIASFFKRNFRFLMTIRFTIYDFWLLIMVGIFRNVFIANFSAVVSSYVV